MKNLKEFKALIKRYESITLDEIKKAFDNKYSCSIIEDASRKLTGFGSTEKCTLCEKGEHLYDCRSCVYANYEGCFNYKSCLKDINEKTFDKVYFADTPLKLRNAYRARAKHMKTLI